MLNLYDKQKNINKTNALANALQSARLDTRNNVTPFQPVQTAQNPESQSLFGGANDLLSGAGNLYRGLQQSGLLNNNSGFNGSNSTISNAINNNIFGGGESNSILSSSINDNIMGTSGNDNVLKGAISENVSSGGGSWASSAPWGAIANVGKSFYNNISGHNPSDYSDTEQGIIYPLQGAANGFSYGGPWGALGGALYGLGYSFKDDIGLDDSNFLTQMLFPIGMGDGGGLRINGNSVLDIL